MIIHEFKSEYNRQGVAEITEAPCDKCGYTRPCLYVDGSEGEYGGCCLCAKCITEGFEMFNKEKKEVHP